MITLTGKTAEEVVEIMKRKLESTAYSAVKHMSYLTEIDPAYLREALTEAFGLMGYGWFLEFDALDLDVVDRHGVKKNKETGEILSEWDEFAVTLLTARFHFCYREKQNEEMILISHPILTTGSSTNRAKGDAIEGAITNSLGKAAKKLLWQLDVYKGKLTHHNAGGRGSGKKKGKKGAKSTASTPASSGGKKNNGNGVSLTPEVLLEQRSHAISDPGEFTSHEFWTVAKGLKVSKEDSDNIVKETSGWADALVAVIDNFGGPEIAELVKANGG